MAIDFPGSPTNGQTFTDGDKTWEYSTSVGAWKLQAQTLTGPTGPTGVTGAYVSGGVAALQDNRTITVTNNPGTSGDDPTIAENKGWTVSG